MKTYDNYIKSRFSFIPLIPHNWIEGKIKFLFKIGRGRVIAQTELKEEGRFPVFSSQTKNNGCLGYINTYDYDEKEIITWTTDGVNAGEVFLRKGKFNCTNVCGTLTPYKEIELKFYLYYLKFATQLYKRPDTNGAKIMNNEMADIYCVIPSILEQTKIANYLDYKTNLIDSAITKKQLLINKLDEKRQSIINKVITKGLNPNVKLKDSGVKWIGDIPEHWDTIKLKYFAKIRNGKDQKPVQVDKGGYPVLGTGGEIGRASEYLHNKPSVLLGRKGTINNPFYIEEPFWTVDTLFYTIIKKEVYPKFFFYQCKCICFDYYQESSAVPSMTQENLNNVFMCKIPYKEQIEIVDYIDKKTNKIDNLTTKLKVQIDNLKEYRQSIIFESVTGKIDLRDWQQHD